MGYFLLAKNLPSQKFPNIMRGGQMEFISIAFCLKKETMNHLLFFGFICQIKYFSYKTAGTNLGPQWLQLGI